jgi:hypothetical protein
MPNRHTPDGGKLMTRHQPSLPTDHAFVVQFRAQTDAPPPLRCEGRVEHVVSGEATHFGSWEQLLRFIEQVLTAVREKPP